MFEYFQLFLGFILGIASSLATITLQNYFAAKKEKKTARQEFIGSLIQFKTELLIEIQKIKSKSHGYVSFSPTENKIMQIINSNSQEVIRAYRLNVLYDDTLINKSYKYFLNILSDINFVLINASSVNISETNEMIIEYCDKLSLLVEKLIANPTRKKNAANIAGNNADTKKSKP
ncbi:MAG: hypothetical protein LBL00_08740 [Endomicrobium sp.]|jgi:hypothetical protein|nr:hypothetical protein [Endomicrobium sp.]